MDEQIDGTVRRGPRWWLRLDGIVLFAGALGLFATTQQPWWLIPLVILLPDAFMLGYAGGTRGTIPRIARQQPRWELRLAGQNAAYRWTLRGTSLEYSARIIS